MASRKAAHEKATSSSTRAESSRPSGSRKAGPSRPPMLHMVLEALRAQGQGPGRGLSVAAIKLYILHTYPAVDLARLKHLLRQALDTGTRRGLLARPGRSRARGATGSFKLVPKKRQGQPRKTPARAAPRKAGEAQEEGSNKPSRAKRSPGDSGLAGEAEELLPGSGAARQRAPKKGCQTEDVQASKGPPKPGKAAPAASSAKGASAESRAKEKKSKPGNAEAHGKTKAAIQSSKPAASQVKNRAVSPPKRKLVAKTPKGRTARGPGEGPRAEPPAPAKGEKVKFEPPRTAGRTLGSRGPKEVHSAGQDAI